MVAFGKAMLVAPEAIYLSDLTSRVHLTPVSNGPPSWNYYFLPNVINYIS